MILFKEPQNQIHTWTRLFSPDMGKGTSLPGTLLIFLDLKSALFHLKVTFGINLKSEKLFHVGPAAGKHTRVEAGNPNHDAE